MKYFGWVAGMSFEKIEQRTYFLAKLLELPSIDNEIGNLSGGQQRRVSFATALIHEPELLILDEPTVGLDPILRESIWNYLLELTKNKSVTIILTTHYIEEAHQADMIGLMRNGVILSEEPPKMLLSRFNVSTLEEAFYQVIVTNTQSAITKRPTLPPTVNGAKDDPILKKHVVKALMWKNFLWMWRHFPIMITTFILPILTVFVFCSCIGGDPTNLKIAVVNHETETRKCEPLKCHSTQLSCHFLRYLDKKAMKLIYYDDENEAISSVQNGKAYAAIVIKKNYTENLELRFRTRDVTDLNINQSTIEVFCDYSVKDIAIYIKKYIYKGFNNFIGDYLDLCEINKESVALPLRYHEPIYGLSEPSMTDFANPGIILTLAFFMAATLTAGITAVERTEGILERTMVMGVSSFEMLLSHILCQIGVMLLQTLTPLVVLFWIFDLTLNGSLINVVFFTVLSGFCGMCAGLSISSNFMEERHVAYILIGMLFPFLILSAILWPIEGMNYYLRILASALPLTLATESLRSILQRGWGFNEPVVYLGLICINVWIVIFLGIGFIGLKFRKK
ncbi:hypothetical protein RI129_012711 [Pyrocoelia pectoralis]|uniref:ABC transmembrane type-2 domain-containing protein n=1 Tax=Pyrocoelia pectoralis TaxID=417401 RepID=A0AAN7V4D2_9COLE